MTRDLKCQFSPCFFIQEPSSISLHQCTHSSCSDGSAIRTFHQVHHSLQLRQHCFMALLLTDVECSILGANFLKKHKLLVDVSRCRLLLPDLLSSVPCSPSSSTSPSLYLMSHDNEPYFRLLCEYLWIKDRVFSAQTPAHGIFHRIPTQVQPVWAWPCHLSSEKPTWRASASFVLPTVSGHLPCMWCPRPMASGDPA